VVLCIVSASEPNLRTVMALKLLQDCRNYETLKESVIGVFAQSDKTYDSSWRDEGQPGPRWRLEERLLGTAKDQVHVVNGYVAVKNRNTRSQNAQNEDLTGCWSNEIKCKFCFSSAPVHICFGAYCVVAFGSSRLQSNLCVLLCVFVFVCACVKYIYAYKNTYSQTYQRA
jgi:hypothetical protein